ncbi:unnamed protein product [Owenia fusiformis]|uniref:non-specific protein-tyrosine kinase n=1 Tax=Owenia fusiformis TaxID=6347 RepID=A0A8S4N3L6_OWEFU|nr:unnamed protein product [Owenia fusiformis]
MAGQSFPPAKKNYFWGRISRDDSELELKRGGFTEGKFLLRESISTPGNYVISIVHNNKVHHYSIERQPDGKVMIADGKRFSGPVELLEHHRKTLDGFLTKPTVECRRPTGQSPIYYREVTTLMLDKELFAAAQRKGLTGAKLADALGPQRALFIKEVSRNLHTKMSWFHGQIDRDEAGRRINMSGHKDGKFLVRQRDDPSSFALTISHQMGSKHYRVDKDMRAHTFCIEAGPKFDNLMLLIDHYYNRTDGLLCKLTEACKAPGFEQVEQVYAGLDDNAFYSSIGDMNLNSTLTNGVSPTRPLQPIGNNPWESGARARPPRPTEPPKIDMRNLIDLDEPETEAPPIPFPRSNNNFKDNLQDIYDTVPRDEDTFNLRREQISLSDTLGSGNFGAVMKGNYKRPDGGIIPVAVKTLKQGPESAVQSSEILKEAKVMAGLKHRHIVRMIGVCKGSDMMLVLELAPLGPLNRYLKDHPSMPVQSILEIMYQVAKGMEYLESVNFIHRDLAARNVLLMDEKFAKISDFGMSKALGMDNEYYKAEAAGKWPLKWYAPECIYYFKFDSKSDVWSYGVTLWEALSYGAKPYKGKKGAEILRMIEDGDRMDKPQQCAPGVYNIMQKCWIYQKEERPTFKEIVTLMYKYRQ